MKLTEKQAIVMLDVLKESLSFGNGLSGYTHNTLERLYNEILNQQSDELIELDKRRKLFDETIGNKEYTKMYEERWGKKRK